MTEGFKVPDNKFWLVWVDGTRGPRKRCRSLEIAERDALRLRNEVTKRNVYIFEVVEMLEGRVLLKYRENALADSVDLV